MKKSLIGSLLVSALLAISATAPAFAQSSYGGKSRAEVKAELATAKRAGDLEAVNSLSYPQLRPYQERHAQTRADGRSGGSSQ